MKKATITMMMLIGMIGTSVAQQEVIENKEPVTISKNTLMSTNLTMFDYGEDGAMYALYFRNSKYTSIVDMAYIKFDSKEDLIQFFDLCDSSVVNKKEYTTATYSISKGAMKSLYVSNRNGAYFYPTLAAINKMRTDLLNFEK